jgi:hypothetical protein
MKPGPLVSLSNRLKRSHLITGRLSVRVRQLPATHRRPERRRPRARHRLSPPGLWPRVPLPSLSTAAHGLSSRPTPISPPRSSLARLSSPLRRREAPPHRPAPPAMEPPRRRHREHRLCSELLSEPWARRHHHQMTPSTPFPSGRLPTAVEHVLQWAFPRSNP